MDNYISETTFSGASEPAPCAFGIREYMIGGCPGSRPAYIMGPGMWQTRAEGYISDISFAMS